MTQATIVKLLLQRQDMFYAYDKARDIAFDAENKRDALKNELKKLDSQIEAVIDAFTPAY